MTEFLARLNKSLYAQPPQHYSVVSVCVCWEVGGGGGGTAGVVGWWCVGNCK